MACPLSSIVVVGKASSQNLTRSSVEGRRSPWDAARAASLELVCLIRESHIGKETKWTKVQPPPSPELQLFRQSFMQIPRNPTL